MLIQRWVDVLSVGASVRGRSGRIELTANISDDASPILLLHRLNHIVGVVDATVTTSCNTPSSREI